MCWCRLHFFRWSTNKKEKFINIIKKSVARHHFFFISITMGVYQGDKNRRWSPSKKNHTLNNICWCRPYCIPLSHQWKSYVDQHNKKKCGATPVSFICVNIGVYHGYENRRWSTSKNNLILNDMCGCRPHFIPLSHQWKSQVDQHDKKGCWATPFFFININIGAQKCLELLENGLKLWGVLQGG